MVLGLSVSSVVVIRGAVEFGLKPLGDPNGPYIIYTVFSDFLASFSAFQFVLSDNLIKSCRWGMQEFLPLS